MSEPTLPGAELEQFRKAKDAFFKKDHDSPLTREQKRNFAGLNYFPENPSLRLEVDIELIPGQQQIEMQTSTGDVQHYMRYGSLQFSVEDQPARLTIYQDSQGGFFLPFVDSLAGAETYPAGRYLEPELISANRFLVDFNLAYNPYCAYNELWSCPLTPFENRVKVPIRAGEKIFHGDE